MIKKKISILLSTIVFAGGLFAAIPVKAAVTNSESTESVQFTDKSGKANELLSESKAASTKATTKATKKKLTIMYYGDADNNLESALLKDVQEMKDGYTDDADINLIVLFDRSPSYSTDKSVFGENFTDTRMYKIEHGKTIRIAGGSQFPEITKTSKYEANMGDAKTLKKFIDSCKANYPADKYSLIISDHGGGARAKTNKSQFSEDDKNLSKAVCWDDTSNDDCIYSAELSDTLTKAESVDVLAYDACLMGTAEVAYQYRPGNGSFEAKYMVASAPSVWGAGFDYKKIFSRLKKNGGTGTYDPAKVTPLQFTKLLVDCQKESVAESTDTTQSLASFDLSKAATVKKSVDDLAKALAADKNAKAAVEKLRGSGTSVPLMHYFDESYAGDWVEYPYFDLYDLASKISKSSSFSTNIKNLAKTVMTNTNAMVKYSFGGSSYKGFVANRNGLSIFLPDGSKKYTNYYTGKTATAWSYQSWYNSKDMSKTDTPYGKLKWCIDGQTAAKNNVGNWFELLDSWFDTSNTSTGGVNGYQW